MVYNRDNQSGRIRENRNKRVNDMTFQIGFTAEHPTKPPRKSVVQVYFEACNRELAYYNDRFDLQCGDLVYVDGKLEGLRGQVTDVNYSFKIKISDYKRVIAVVDTEVHGKLWIAGSHLVSFERETLPVQQVKTWFIAPASEEEEFVSGSDDTTFFDLETLNRFSIDPVIAERGVDYYRRHKVQYLCLDGGKGYAIVQGREAYEVEFSYTQGQIRDLTCTCFCSYHCKHEFAVMLQLREILRWADRQAEQYGMKHSGYFAAIEQQTLFQIAINGRTNGCLTL